MKRKITVKSEAVPPPRKGRPPEYPFAELLAGKSVRCIGDSDERRRFVGAAKNYLGRRRLKIRIETRGQTVSVWNGGPRDV